MLTSSISYILIDCLPTQSKYSREVKTALYSNYSFHPENIETLQAIYPNTNYAALKGLMQGPNYLREKNTEELVYLVIFAHGVELIKPESI
jgi:hypothetical protein